MNDLDTLRTGLAQLATEVTPVDLRARVLASSRRLAARRIAAGLATAVAATVTASALLLTLNPAAGPAPGPSPSPGPSLRPTTLPAYVDPPAPDIGPFPDATITVPSWGRADNVCATGPVKLSNVQYDPGAGKPVLTVLAAVSTDVDGDGSADYVAQLACGEGPEGPAQQIVAYRRSGTRLVLLGRVVGTQDGVAMVDSVEVRGAGRIAVQVSAGYSDGGIRYVPNQWRVYAWQGGRFRQVSGPTTFPADPPAATLSVTSSPLTFTRTAGGYVGELTVTAANTGTLDVAAAELRLIVPLQLQPAGDGWTGCAVVSTIDANAIVCPVAGLTAGSTRQLRFGFVATTVPVRGDEPIGLTNRDHALFLSQLPPYVFERPNDAFEASFTIVAP